MLAVLCLLTPFALAQEQDQSWPPPLEGAVNGTVTFTSDLFLQIPPAVQQKRADEGAALFHMDATPPIVDLVFHGDLPNRALNGTGWSSWGDIALASDGRVYVGVGDHGDDAGGKAHAYLYQWDPVTKVLKQVVDLNTVVPRTQGESAWSKLHARIEEGADGNIYFSGTLNDGNMADQPQFKWSEAIPGGQLCLYNPQTGEASLVASLPDRRCTATAMIDRQRNIWWCNLETGPNGLWAFDLTTKQPLYQTPDGAVIFNRNFAMDREGYVYFNGEGGIWKCDAQAQTMTPMQSNLGEGASGMRASTDEDDNGWIYGHTMGTNQIFRFAPAQDKVELLGPNFMKGEYTTVCVLSPDQKYVYYLPGAHGQAADYGTPVIQYDIAQRQQKVLAFMAPALEQLYHYVPGGTYGVKLSADGGTLYVNFNGHAADATRPAEMRPTGFGLTAFCAIHIPDSER